MRRLIFLSISLLLMHASALQAQNVRFIEVLTLGDDENASREYLFAAPWLVDVDSNENIYVADAQNVEVKVFDQDGIFLNTIGARGKGPGELQEVTGLIVNDKGNVIVIDRFNQRATWFSRKGQLLESSALLDDQYLDIRNVYLLNDDSFLFNYKVPHQEQGLDPTPELFHVFGKNLESVRTSFGDFDTFYNKKEPFERSLGLRSKINATTDGQDFLYVAPSFYEGIIYRIDLNQIHRVSVKLQGHKPDFPSYKLVEEKSLSIDPNKPYMGMGPFMYATNSAETGRFFAISQNRSYGLFILSDGRLVHFTDLGEGDERTYGIEVFSKEGVFEGYFPIEGYTVTSDNPFVMMPLAVDGKDQFYITDNRSGFYVLRVVKLDFDQVN